jgi:hypothetical protein
MRQVFRSVLILSMGLNLVLVVILFRGPSPVASKARPLPVALKTIPQAGTITVPDLAPMVTFVTNRFHWRQIESRDYDQFVANLRGVGCPESTLRDIVVADIRKTYAEKAATVPLQVDFWTGGARRAAALGARESKRRSLAAEKEALLSRLLGPGLDLGEEDDHRDGFTPDELTREAFIRFIIGPVPERAYRQVPAIMQKSDEQANEITSRGLMLPEDHARLRELRQQTMVELHSVLTPEQFLEFAQRSAVMNHMENALEEVKATAADWRQIAGLCLEVYGPLDRGVFGDLPGGASEDAVVAQEQRFQDGLKKILGEARYSNYERLNDPAFQGASTVAEQSQLPPETAVKVYEMKKLLEAETRRLREDASLSPAALQEKAAALSDTTREQVRNLLGEKAYQALLRQGNNAWVTNSVAP